MTGPDGKIRHVFVLALENQSHTLDDRVVVGAVVRADLPTIGRLGGCADHSSGGRGPESSPARWVAPHAKRGRNLSSG
jgi:hypothetical protein